MTKWLVNLTYKMSEKSGGNTYKGISETTCIYNYNENVYVNFNGNYPTESEIEELKEKKKMKIETGYYIEWEYYVYPTITFMQKLDV